jgi:hypothetical protein
MVAYHSVVWVALTGAFPSLFSFYGGFFVIVILMVNALLLRSFESFLWWMLCHRYL